MPGLFDKIKRAEFCMPPCSDAAGAAAGSNLEPNSPSRRNPYARARSCSPQKEKEKDCVRFSGALIELLENILVADPRKRWSLQQVGSSAWMQGSALAPVRISNKSQLAISPQRAPTAPKRKISGACADRDENAENTDPNKRRQDRSRASSSNPLHEREEEPSQGLSLAVSAEKRRSSGVKDVPSPAPTVAPVIAPEPAAPQAEMQVESVTAPHDVSVQLGECALLAQENALAPPLNACCTLS